MKREVKDINVKSLMEEINTSATAGEIVCDKKVKRIKRDNEYTYILASGCDFILNRKTVKTNKTLVCIQSKGILFIYDEIKQKKIVIEEAKTLKTFFNDKLASEIVIEPEKLCYAKSGIRKDELDAWFGLVKENNPALLYIMKRGLCNFRILYGHYCRSFPESLKICYENNPGLLASIFQKNNKVYLSEYEYIANYVNWIYEAAGVDAARYFIEKLTLSSVSISGYGLTKIDIKSYNLNPRRFIDYILFDLYRQGKDSLDLRTYGDYLKQEMDFYGKVRDKYPASLETAHQIISQKVNEKQKLKSDSPKFAEIMMESEDFSYQNSIDKFKIVMPEKSLDLVEEGRYLCHCVASYIEKVNNGDCIVVFMREKENIELPYLTIEILPNRSVVQVEGMNKRSELSEEEILFINRWAKSKHLKVAAGNAIMTKEMKKKNKETL